MNRFVFGLFCALFMWSGCASDKKPATPASEGVKAPAPVPAVTPVAVATAVPTAAAPTAPVVEAPQVDVSVDSATVVIQKYTEELRSIVDPAKQQKGAKRDTSKEKKIAEKVRQFFDFEGLAKMSLGRHWMRATPAQREEYSDLFVGLIEDSYLRRTKDIVGDYKLVYGREIVKGNNAKVTCRVVRDDADVDITYELHRNPKNWMIFNITLDNVDLIRNYQTQFNRIIEQEGFNGLVSRLRKKKDEIDKEFTL